MTTSTLKNKLSKMNISFNETDYNGYNKDICFSINGMNFCAGFELGNDEIQDFCREICFDNTNQDMQRRFFKNFNELIKYSNYNLTTAEKIRKNKNKYL
jgi:hypothetical protein